MGIINRPNNYSSNTTISSSQVNDDFNTIYNEFNGGIAAANLASDSVTTAKIAAANVTNAKLADSAATPEKLLAGTGTSWVWQSYTPTITSNSGSFTTTSATGKYAIIGKTVHFRVALTITTIGTAVGLNFSLPVTANSASSPLGIGACREDALTGNMGFIRIATTSTASVARYDNGNIMSGGSGSKVEAYGTYDAA